MLSKTSVPDGRTTTPSRGRLAQLREQYFTLRAVIDRCDRQSALWAGHSQQDNARGNRHWTDLARSHVAQAELAITDSSQFEDTMLDIAALALAALESSRRRRGATWQEELLLGKPNPVKGAP